jgi:hypothetical protein
MRRVEVSLRVEAEIRLGLVCWVIRLRVKLRGVDVGNAFPFVPYASISRDKVDYPRLSWALCIVFVRMSREAK